MKTKKEIINKIIVVLLTIMVGLVGMLILISGLFNKKQPTILDDTTTTIELEVINTNIPSKQKKVKKVVKTIKKITTKKATKKKTNSKIHIKYNRKEIENYVYQEVVRRWGEEHWIATYNIISYESGFNPNSWNKKNTACGLFQANPCKKTIKNGYKDYYTNWKTQVIWGLDYISYKYGNPNNAWKHWKKYGSY